MERSGTTAGLRGIHAAGPGVAWACGTNGTVLRTEDGGYEWQQCAMPPGAEKLDFRGIWAWDANTAIVMSSGTGDLSRLYKTTDGCASWKLVLKNRGKNGFWDAVIFDGDKAATSDGWLLGDPVRHEFQLRHTVDGGKNWRLERGKAPQASPGAQGVFAASNSALVLLTNDLGVRAFPAFGSGGSAGAFFYEPGTLMVCIDACNEVISPPRSGDWVRAEVPLAGQNDSSGVFSADFRDANHGVAVGGDYRKPNESAGTAAWSADDGKTWTAAEKMPHGFRSAVEWDADAKAWIAVGTNGSDISYDDGKTWVPLDNGNWNALSLPWVVGPGGRIAKLDPHRLPK